MTQKKIIAIILICICILVIIFASLLVWFRSLETLPAPETTGMGTVTWLRGAELETARQEAAKKDQPMRESILKAITTAVSTTTVPINREDVIENVYNYAVELYAQAGVRFTDDGTEEDIGSSAWLKKLITKQIDSKIK